MYTNTAAADCPFVQSFALETNFAINSIRYGEQMELESFSQMTINGQII